MLKDLSVVIHVLLFSLNLLEPSTREDFLPCLPVAQLSVEKEGGVTGFPRDCIQDGRKLQKCVFGLLDWGFRTSVGMKH